MTIEHVIKNLTFKKIIVGGMSLFFGIFMLRELIAFIAFHLLFSTVSHQWEDQQKEMGEFNQEAKTQMRQIERGMDDEVQAVQQGVNDMQKTMTDFKSEFSGAEKVQKEIANALPEFLKRAKEHSRWVEEQARDFTRQTKRDSEEFLHPEHFKK